jgi:hypothetical protein
MKMKTTTLALPVCLLLSSIVSLAQADNSNEKVLPEAYFKAELSAIQFDLPAYKDGFGVVDLAPVSGAYFSKGEKQDGEAITLTGGAITDYAINAVDGLLFFEGSSFYSQSDESYSELLGSDGAGNRIRFALFDGSDGYNSSSANPLHYQLKSDLEYFGANLAVGIANQAFGWNMRYQVGPQFLWLNQDYKLYGSSPTDASSRYNRHETLDTNYFGLRMGITAEHAISEKMNFEGGLGLAALRMNTDYNASDARLAGGGSSLSRSLNEDTYGADLKLALRYAFTPSVELGLNFGLSYLDKTPEIIHATGATGNGSFVPARLDTDQVLVKQTGIEFKTVF